jgi:Single-strand binding protein family
MSFFQRTFRPVAAKSANLARTFSTTQRAQFARMSLIARLGIPPELSQTATGKTIVKYAVANNYGKRDDQKTSWWNVSAFMPEGAQRDYLMGLPKG